MPPTTAVLWSTGNFAFRNGGGRTGRSAMFEVVLGAGVHARDAEPSICD